MTVAEDILNPPPVKNHEHAFKLIENIISDQVSKFAVDPPGRLWHYISANGVHAILKNNSLRLGNIRFMNDSSEFVESVSMIKNSIIEFKKHHKESEAQIYLDALRNYIDVVDDKFVPGIYILCLSEKKDDLNQWRAYTGVGQGYSIGFDSNELIPPKGMNFRLLKCIYRLEDQVEILGNCIGSSVMVFIGLERGGVHRSDDIRHRSAKLLAEETIRKLTDVMVAIKYRKFHEESEWRLVVYNPDINDIGYEPRLNYISSFYTLSPEKPNMLPIQKIWVGPNQLKETNSLVLMSMTKQYGHTDIEVEYSDIPFRLI